MKEKIGNSNFKTKFITLNKNWYHPIKRLFDNIRTILTPRTIFEHRNTLISKLNSINGPPALEVVTPLSFINNFKYVLDISEKELLKGSLGESFMKIIKAWRIRARRRMRIKSQIAGILELLTEPACLFCQGTWGLKCESIDNEEDVFLRFLISKRLTLLEDWEPREWQEFFRENSVFRTVCYSCHKELEPKPFDGGSTDVALLFQNIIENLEKQER